MTSLTDKKIFIARIKLETMWGHFQENNVPSFIRNCFHFFQKCIMQSLPKTS